MQGSRSPLYQAQKSALPARHIVAGFLLPFLLPFNLFIGADVPKSVFQKKRVVDHTHALKPSDCVNNPQRRTIATIESVAGKGVNALAPSAFQRDNMLLVFIRQLLAQLLPQAENLVVAGSRVIRNGRGRV